MSNYKVLVLTDHRGHSQENSLYALVRALQIHPSCASVHVASRGQTSNEHFFNGQSTTRIFGTKVDDQFKFSTTGSSYDQSEQLSVTDFQVVLMRMPRPITDEFLLWIEAIFQHSVIINRPSGIIETSDKSYLTGFQHVCPPMKLCHSLASILDFSSQQDIVLKPLRAYGGQGILKITGGTLDDGTGMYQTKDYLRKIEEYIHTEGYLAMKYLKNVTQGDKRILVVGGEILAASLRLPLNGSWLCNVSQGGQSKNATISEEEKVIINTITEPLLRKGILIFGADTLVDDNNRRVLSEINTLSIGGFMQAEKQTGRPILKLTIDKIMQYVDAQLS